MTRERFQELLWDYLYDLLESHGADSKAEFERLLKTDAGCRGLLAEAKSQRELLAAAARQAAPMEFQPPLTMEPRRFSVVSSVGRSGAALRWALAACLFLGLAGGAAPAFVKERKLRAEANDAQMALARLELQLNEARAEEKKVADSRRNAQQELRQVAFKQALLTENLSRKAKSQNLYLTVARPAIYEAGAPYTLLVNARDLADQPVPASLEVRVFAADRNEVVVPAEKVVAREARPGVYQVSLPPDLNPKLHPELMVEIAAKTPQGLSAKVAERLQLFSSSYVTHLVTDKPMYDPRNPNETVWFRSLTLERATLRPPKEDLNLVYTLSDGKGQKVHEQRVRAQVADQSGQIIKGPDGQPLRGLGCGAYPLPPDAAGGEYTLTVAEANNRFPPETRKFIVNRYEKPRLKKELEWTRKSYGPGDDVAAACKVTAAEGGKPLAGKPVDASISIDGTSYGPDGQPSDRPLKLVTDGHGEVIVKFKLPPSMDKGLGSLAVRFTDGGNQETLIRPIPIVVNKVFLGYFPEGGDLIAGVPNRVYFHARTPTDRPAELKGRLIDEAGNAVAALETFADDKEPGANQGVGAFSFTPEVGKRYRLKVESPAGALPVGALPEVKAEGVTLTVSEGVGIAGPPIHVSLSNVGPSRNLLVGAYCRGRTVDQQPLRVESGKSAVLDLKTEPAVGGVYRITVFEERQSGAARKLVPLAERLIYRGSGQRLDVKLKTLREKYIPGEKAGLALETLDEKNQPVPSIVMAAVVDKNVLTLADEKTARAMPTHFLLTSEVRKPEDLEHADFLLADHPKAPQALDLLLGTQGWRRFAEQNPAQFKQEHAEDAAALFARQGQELPPAVATNYEEVSRRMEQQLQLELSRAVEPLAAETAKAQEKLQKSALDLDAFQNGPNAGLIANAPNLLEEMKKRLATATAEIDRFRGQTIPLAGLFLLGLVLMGVTFFLPERSKAMWAVAAAACLLILGTVVWYGLGATRDVKDRAALAHIGEARDWKQVGGDAQHMQPAQRLGDGDPPGGGPGGNARFGQGGAGREVVAPPPPPAPRGMDRGELMEAAGTGGAAPTPLLAPKAAVPHAQPDAMKLESPMEVKLEAQPAFGGELRRMDSKQQAESATRAERPKPTTIESGAKTDYRFNPEAALKKPGEPLGRVEVGKELRQKDAVPGAPASSAAAAGRPSAAKGAGKDAEIGRGEARGRRAPPAAMGGGGGGRGGIPTPLAAEPAVPRIGYLNVDGKLKEVEKQLRFPAYKPAIVRQYSHFQTGGAKFARTDFAETLLWQPVVVLPKGTGRLDFHLCDSITTFEAICFAHTLDGRLGAGKLAFEVKTPFNVEPKLPTEITATDEVAIPVAIASGLDAAQKVDLNLGVAGLAIVGPAEAKLEVGANARTRSVFRVKALIPEGLANLTLDGRSESGFSDSLARSLRIVPDGFPIVESRSGQLTDLASHEVVLPPSCIKGTLHLYAAAYPSTLADLQQGLEGLLREPHGCFEQTSSSSYPNTLILDYLIETKQTKPEMERRARDLLERGYQKLVGFECYDPANQRKGYEWFGGRAAPHEALTAYGLLQFTDMAKLRPVDPEMLKRTREYLLGQRDGQGGFRRNPRALDQFGSAPQEVTNAYIVWSLTESGAKEDLAAELMALKQTSEKSNDPYFLALVANSLMNVGQANEARERLKRLAEMQAAEGWLQGASTSITGSRGRDLQIETTALALLGWMKVEPPGEFTGPVNKSIKWLTAQRGGYGAFGSTQSTILALKSLIAYAKKNARPVEDGELILMADGQELGKVPFTAKTQDAIELRIADAERLLKPGLNKVRLLLTGKNSFPYTLRWSYQTITPPSVEGCPLSLTTKLDKTQLVEGDACRLTVKVKNVSGQGQGMAVAIIGLPAGLTLPEDMKQLKEYARLRDDDTKPGLIGAWETRGRELILYWRGLAPDQEIEVPIDLAARVPGKYRGPASRAYLYYNADAKCWIDPLAVEIQAK